MKALAFLLAGSALSAAAGTDNVNVRWDPPAKQVKEVIAEFDGKDTVVPVVDGVSVHLPSASGNAAVLRTPFHAPCTVRQGEPCVLVAYPVVTVFGKASGRVWWRPEASRPFREAPAIPLDWGKGHALPDGQLDLVVAATDHRARLFLNAKVGDLANLPKGGPAAVVGQFVSEPGNDGLAGVPIDVDPNASPQVDASRAKAWADLFRAAQLKSDGGGRFRIEPVPDDAVVFLARSPGRPPYRFGVPKSPAPGVVDLGRLRISGFPKLTLTIVPQADLPSPSNLEVQGHLFRADSGTAFAPHRRSFKARPGVPLDLDDLPPGTWEFHLFLNGEPIGSRTLLLAEPQRFDWTITEEEIGGVVATADQKPLANTRVTLRRPRGNPQPQQPTDEEGQFRFRILFAGGRVGILFRNREQGIDTVEVVEPGTTAARDIRVTIPGGDLSVRVLEAETTRPPEKALVQIVSKEAKGLSVTKPVDGKGIAVFSEIPLGRYEVFAGGPDYAQEPSREVVLGKGEPETLDFELHRAKPFHGKVLDPGGGPIAGAVVAGPHGIDSGAHRAVTNAEGAFELKLRPGVPAVISAAAMGRRIVFRALVPDPETPVEIILPSSGADALIEIRSDDGEPIDHAQWTLIAEGVAIDMNAISDGLLASGCPFASTSAEGTLQIGRCLADGVYALRIMRPSAKGEKPSVWATPTFLLQSGRDVRVQANRQGGRP